MAFQPFCLSGLNGSFFFLPDCIFLWDGMKYRVYPHASVQFRVACDYYTYQTYQHVTRKGLPDKRYKTNLSFTHSVPVHADVKAETAEETLFVFRLSDQQMANQLVRLLNGMGDVARKKSFNWRERASAAWKRTGHTAQRLWDSGSIRQVGEGALAVLVTTAAIADAVTRSQRRGRRR